MKNMIFTLLVATGCTSMLTGCYEDIKAPFEKVFSVTYQAPGTDQQFSLFNDTAKMTIGNHRSVERFYEEQSKAIHIKMSTDPTYAQRWLVFTKLDDGELLCVQCAKYNWPSHWVKVKK
ncbi:hypothetical protein OH460_08390 [Vibrio sp. Makdt]|uniref:hypothetical protein n=1 Tax=Vibrio sp. Makdt TaxID=2998828 RepID=UPI0022CD3443|nr:hypothetical protein [Vibrio sp. Makdt]MDA0152318.1 hypothetical protein [Vibrio sp. Makdt]